MVNVHVLSVPGARAVCRAAQVSFCPSASAERFSISDRLSVSSEAYTWSFQPPPGRPPLTAQRSVGVGYVPGQVQLKSMREGSRAGVHVHSGCLSDTSAQNTRTDYQPAPAVLLLSSRKQLTNVRYSQ